MPRRRAKSAAPRPAYTVIELLVVISLIMILMAIMLPWLQRSREMARRVKCMSNLKHINMAVTAYAVENDDEVIPCRFRDVTIAFNPQYGSSGDAAIDWIDALASVNLVQGREADPVWNCPSRDYKSQWEAGFSPNQLIIGYQYFGGIQTWTNPSGSFPSASPVFMATAQPTWALAADAAMKIDGVWGGGRVSAYGGLPAHTKLNPWPEGGHSVTVDGAVAWHDFEEMTFNHSWSPGSGSNLGPRAAYWYQKDLGEYQPPASSYGKP